MVQERTIDRMDLDERLCLDLGLNVLRELRFAAVTCERREQALAACAEILHLVPLENAGGHFPELDKWENAWRSFVIECERSDRLSEWLRLGLNLDLDVAPTFYAALMSSFRARNQYRWIPVADLPPPHNPFRCDHSEHFARFLRKRKRQAQLVRVLTRKATSPVKVELAAGADFRRWLTSSAAPPCSWHTHGTDWAEVVVWTRKAWDANHSSWTRQAVSCWVESHVPVRSRLGVLAMVSDPIGWSGRDSALANGQHRALALRGAGVSEVLVAVPDGANSRATSTRRW